MSKPVKQMVTEHLRARYGDLDSALWVQVVGVDGTTTNALRRELRKRGMRLEVVKTSLFRRAVADRPLRRLAEALEGPAALITAESLPEAARLLEDWMPRVKGLRLRGALLEGWFLDEKAVAQLSRMPGKRELQAQVAAAVRAPGARLGAALLGPGAAVAGCLKTLIERLEKGQAPQGAVVAAAAEA